MLRSPRGLEVAVRQVGRADQSKVAEVQITSKDFPSAATRASSRKLRRNTEGVPSYRCRDTTAQLWGPDARLRVLRHLAAAPKLVQVPMRLQAYPEPGSAMLCMQVATMSGLSARQLDVRQFWEIETAEPPATSTLEACSEARRNSERRHGSERSGR